MVIRTVPRRSTTFLTTILAIILAGCSSGRPQQSSGTTTSTTTTTTTTTTTSTTTVTKTSPPTQRPSAGRVTNVPASRGYVDEQEASPEDPVFAGGNVWTDGAGSLQFDLDRKIDQCTLTQATKVFIQPSAEVLLGFGSGRTVCRTNTDSDVVTLAAGSSTELRLSDPLFVVSVTPDETKVQVLDGLVQVKSTETNQEVLLGPKREASVFPGGGPTDPNQWAVGDLADDLRDIVNREAEFIERPDLSRPDPDGSPTLQRIQDTGTMLVGIDGRLLAESAEGEFARWFVTYQTDNWSLEPIDPTILTIGEGVDALAANKIDLFISWQPPDDAATIGFSDDQQGVRTLLMFDGSDKAFGDAERSFLRNTVLRGSYATMYREFFGSETTFKAVAELFSLD